MTLVTGPGQAPGQPGGEDPGRGGEQAKTTNPSASSQPLGAERHDVNVTMPGATDTTATQADLDRQDRVTFPLPQGASVMPSARTEVTKPDTTPPPETEDNIPLTQRRMGRRGLLIGGGLALLAGTIGVGVSRGRGNQAPSQQAPTRPTAPNPTEAPTQPEVPQQAWWDTFPETGEEITGSTPGEAYTSFVSLLEWIANNPNGTTPNGQTSTQLLDSLLHIERSRISPDVYTDSELLRAAILQLHKLDPDRIHEYDRLGFRFNTGPIGEPFLRPDAQGSLSNTDVFSIAGNIDFKVEGYNTALSPNAIAITDQLAHSYFNQPFTSYESSSNTYRGGKAQFVFKKIDGQWKLYETTKLGDNWLPPQ